MANLTFENIRIAGIAACVPKGIARNEDLSRLMPPEDLEKLINNIGITEKRVGPPELCSSDYCYEAAKRLLEVTGVDKDTIDVLIFMSQTPDYVVPATAPSLQHRLGLPKSCASFDISLSCSGYIYALATAFAYAAQPTIRRVLVLDGETITKLISNEDKVNAPLYGDAGTATLIEKGGDGTAQFSLFSDGSGVESIIIPAGGCRKPSTAATLEPRLAEDGNIRSENQIYMDGMEVFNFTMKVVPQSVLGLMAYAGVELSEIDHLLFHQANRFMTNFFAKKIKCSKEKIPYSIEQFGNTSSASIPLTIVVGLEGQLLEPKKIIMSGFGAGLSWGAVLMDMSDCIVPPLVEI